MSIKGTRVLVDGYNIQMAQGTGIKTYGLTLINALQGLGADVSVLFGRPAPETQNPILDEVLFFDTDEILLKLLEKPRPIRILNILADLLSTLGGTTYSATPINTKAGVVYNAPIQGSLIGALLNLVETTNFLNIPDCYSRANALFKLFGTNAKVTVPEKFDIFHATYTIPVEVKGTKKITTIHDLIPLRLPSTTLDNKKIFYKMVEKSIKESAAIITVSENSRQDILKIFDTDPQKIFVTYQPVNPTPSTASEEGLEGSLKKFRLSPQEYILFVGAIEPKKNVGRLIDAYAQLDTNLKLVIVGKRGWMWEDEIGKIDQIFSKQKALKQTRLLDYVSYGDLKNLYAGAFCFCFPSLYEGFGLPPLEAMAHGCPVITSNISSLPEVCGDAALYVNPYDEQDIGAKLSMLINEPARRAAMIEKGYEQVKKFDVANYQQRLSQVYESVL
ncbi:MAG: glycosyltransferase family 4 protein [Synechococcales cyanobacterium T60_A2020_003]|nr:glycosyltransferase family 4 protein [Synechococcales cyanobacterium T60_A2020_003]